MPEREGERARGEEGRRDEGRGEERPHQQRRHEGAEDDDNEASEEEFEDPRESEKYKEVENQLALVKDQLKGENAFLGEAFLKCSVDKEYEKAIAQLNRYETSIERAFYRALHELQRIQAMKAGRQAATPVAIDVHVDTAERSSG